MTTPRAHADLATLYFSDSEMKCWIWDEFGGKWQELDDPSFSPEFIYHVGKTAPTEPPQTMCELAGVKFPMPETKVLDRGTGYWVPTLNEPDSPEWFAWRGDLSDEANLAYMITHLSKEAAIQHGKALAAANMQSIEKSKEQMK